MKKEHTYTAKYFRLHRFDVRSVPNSVDWFGSARSGGQIHTPRKGCRARFAQGSSRARKTRIVLFGPDVVSRYHAGGHECMSLWFACHMEWNLGRLSKVRLTRVEI